MKSYFAKTYAKILRKQSEEVREHAKKVIDADKGFKALRSISVEDEHSFKHFKVGKYEFK